MKKMILLMVFVTVTAGQLSAQTKSNIAYYREWLDRFGIMFTPPYGFTESPAEGRWINHLFEFPVSGGDYALDFPGCRVVYSYARRYAFREGDLPSNMLRADRLRYLIAANICKATGDTAAAFEPGVLPNPEKDIIPPPIARQISFIGPTEAAKRFNADSILLYTIPVQDTGNFKYCTSMMLFKNPAVLSIVLLLSEKEWEHQDEYLAKLNETIWFPDEVTYIRRTENQNTGKAASVDTALAERIAEALRQSGRNDTHPKRKSAKHMRSPARDR